MFIYSDASFSKKHAMGIAGYLIFKTIKDHEASAFSSAIISLFKIEEQNNIRLEMVSAISALETARNDARKDVITQLFTDCETIVNLSKRRERLESSDYMSARQNKVLNNADLYKLFFALCDEVSPKITWVKGHSRKNDQSHIQKNFSHLDQLVRRELRGY